MRCQSGTLTSLAVLVLTTATLIVGPAPRSVASPSTGRVYLPILARTYLPFGDDEFNGPRLSPRWTIVNEDSAQWSLSARPGFLRITTHTGAVGDRNLLLQPAPPGDFDLRTRLLFAPTRNFQAAGLVLYQDADNYWMLCRGYCGFAGPACVGNGIYFDGSERGIMSGFSSLGTTVQGEAYLRVVRLGGTYTAYYSPDGVDWTLVGSRSPPAGMNLSRVGLTAARDSASPGTAADFDFFRFASPAMPDLIFHNGIIVTMEQGQPHAQAIAVRGESIVAVGSDAQVLALRGARTRTIDLRGMTILPGFVDAHNHLFNDAARLGLDKEGVQRLALESGITTMANMYCTPEFLAEMQAYQASGKLRVRTSLYLNYTSNCGVVLGDWYKQHPPTRNPGEMLRIGGVKIFTDGGSCGAPAISCNHPVYGRGDLWFTQEQLNAIVADVQRAGYQAAIHALGDRAVEQALLAIQSALGGLPNSARHRIEHNAVVRDDLLPLYGPIGVVPLIFGSYPACAPSQFALPAACLPWEWRWRDLVAANPGLHFAWHSDMPALGLLSPLKSLYSMVTTHQVQRDGTVCELLPSLTAKTLTVEQVLPMMTIEGAYALFREGELGSLKPGKFADLVVLSASPLAVPPEAIKDIQVRMAMVGGKVEYCAPGQEGLCPGHGLN